MNLFMQNFVNAEDQVHKSKMTKLGENKATKITNPLRAHSNRAKAGAKVKKKKRQISKKNFASP